MLPMSDFDGWDFNSVGLRNPIADFFGDGTDYRRRP